LSSFELRQSSDDAPEDIPKVPSPRAEGSIDEGAGAKHRLSPQPESPKKTALELRTEPIVIDLESPTPGTVKDDSTQGFVLVPRNPFTHPESSSDSESGSDLEAKETHPSDERAPSSSHHPASSSGARVDPNAQRL
jgi:hypothetical protein